MERVLYLLYSILGSILCLPLPLLLPVACFLRGRGLPGARYAYRLEERLGGYPDAGRPQPGLSRLWVHAASVGEVQAAILLIEALLRTGRRLDILLTSTTEQGNRLALSRLAGRVLCLMAPLDAPWVVARALRRLRPDLYICLETELWPVMLVKAQKTGIPLLLLNARLSEFSFGRYRRIRPFMRALLARFQAVAAISEADGARFLALGLAKERLRVCGNLKYDLAAKDQEETRVSLRRALCLSGHVVLVCGSTHEDEERQLLAAYARLRASLPLVWILAPRHLERLPALEALFREEGLLYERYSALQQKRRGQSLILVDTIGDLADLYGCGDYLFCGGSLVNKGGHNMMEAARWGRPVYFGPHVKNFRDAAGLLTAGGGGFQVRDAEALAVLILRHHSRPEEYRLACEAAGRVAREQQGAVERQKELVLDFLPPR